MPRRKFVYSTSGVVDVTPAETRALCDEIHADVAERSAFARGYSNRGRNVSIWPVHSDSMACSDREGVLVEQAELAKYGVKCEYDEHFRPIWTSARHKKAYQRALGHADPDAGYADAEPLFYQADMQRPSPTQRKERLEKMREELIAKEYRLFGQRVSSI